MRVTIRTRYVNHPGSNVGAYLATGAGRSAKLRTDQALTSAENHRRAAATLAARIGAAIPLEERAATASGYAYTTLEAWDADKARELQATARRLFRDHGHAGHWDALTRENCGACALEGYGDDVEPDAPIGPNYAGWARIYVEAGRPIPERYREAFRVELAGAPYGDGRPNELYADALRRDILTFGGWPLEDL